VSPLCELTSNQIPTREASSGFSFRDHARSFGRVSRSGRLEDLGFQHCGLMPQERITMTPAVHDLGILASSRSAGRAPSLRVVIVDEELPYPPTSGKR